MSVEVLDLKWNWRLSQGLVNIGRNHHWTVIEMMDGRAAAGTGTGRAAAGTGTGTGTGTGRASSLVVAGSNKDYHHGSMSISQGNNSRKSFPASYFSVESFLVLVCLTASLLILPVILPPLPPPPFMLLLLPILILAVLMILAFMPSDLRDIASSFV